MRARKRVMIRITALIMAASVSVVGFDAAASSNLAPFVDTLYSVSANSTNVLAGKDVMLSATTSRDTTSVKVMDQNGNTLAESTSYTEKSGRRVWSIPVNLPQEGMYKLTIYTGVSYGYCSFKDIMVEAVSGIKPTISNVKVSYGVLSCSVAEVSSISDARLEIRNSSGSVVYSDYKGEVLSAGSYSVVAYIRDDPAGLASDPVSFTVSSSDAEEAEFIKLAVQIINANEGAYDTVVADDNGALSVGLFGWHAYNAHDLINRMKELEPATVEECLAGTNLLYELSLSNEAWRYKIPNATEVAALKKLLRTDVSHRVQDEFAAEYVSTYVKSGRNLGITAPGALLYYVDLHNQSPLRAKEITNAVKADGKALVLDNMHSYALANPVMGKYTYRRNKTYNTIRSMGFTS